MTGLPRHSTTDALLVSHCDLNLRGFQASSGLSVKAGLSQAAGGRSCVTHIKAGVIGAEVWPHGLAFFTASPDHYLATTHPTEFLTFAFKARFVCVAVRLRVFKGFNSLEGLSARIVRSYVTKYKFRQWIFPKSKF